jgi:hypothetical protein
VSQTDDRGALFRGRRGPRSDGATRQPSSGQHWPKLTSSILSNPGPSAGSKLDTILARSQATLNRCVQYMGGTDAYRARPEVALLPAKLPKLTQAVILEELIKHLDVPVHFAEGEADAVTAELAQQRRGYVVSQGEWRC